MHSAHLQCPSNLQCPDCRAQPPLQRRRQVSELAAAFERLGVDRVLTSGRARCARDGCAVVREMHIALAAANVRRVRKHLSHGACTLHEVLVTTSKRRRE